MNFSAKETTFIEKTSACVNCEGESGAHTHTLCVRIMLRIWAHVRDRRPCSFVSQMAICSSCMIRNRTFQGQIEVEINSSPDH